MSVLAVCGVNWGDEGKGRMVDYFACESDFVVRFQGGNNAGHTVVNEFGKFALHMIPSGVFNKKAINIVGNGTVINPEALLNEIKDVEKTIGEIKNLYISNRAHIIFPFHILLDEYEEERLRDAKFGSTKRGIAPVYSDKYLKIGILSSDLLDKDYLKKRLAGSIVEKNEIFKSFYKKPEINLDEMVEWGYSFGEKIKKYIVDPLPMLNKAIKENKSILLEGQLGALRDIEFGIYPFTTSSSPIAGYAGAGSGIPPREIKDVLGVMKAYSSCVGEGPFVTEIFDKQAESIREKGNEYGASTGRPRRIGHFDAVASRYGAMVSSSTEIAITLLDVLSGEKELKICTEYEVDGKRTKDFPITRELVKAKPIYITMDGWSDDITGVRDFNKLPEAAKKYILKIEELIETKIKYVSVGPNREQLIIR